ncbi:MAG: hypothetical protein JXX29_06985 [Deltaproteobacteria bacterium]|nr:hypothetical protein [Deltaproteobacteria bacterium]MBN2671398.1 hypothetical protein [Deltaproteobacteria bacterium]
MKMTMDTGVSGWRTGFNSSEKSGWLLPIVLLLGAAAVIALLLFSLHQRTEAKFLQMQYLVEDVQADADEKVRIAQQEVFVISQKYETVQNDIKALKARLAKMDDNASQKASKQERPVKNRNGKGNKPKPSRNGLEDLDWGGETALTSAQDDPSAGFKRGELL